MLTLSSVEILFGDINLFNEGKSCLCIFDENICDFLISLSDELFKNEVCRPYADIMTFAYWCRKGNLHHLRNMCIDDNIRIGLGTLFHISPSNVPINFVFSFVFGLLSGNSNIIKIPTKKFNQIDIIIESMKNVSKKNDIVFKRNLIIRYDKDSEVTDYLINNCDCKVVWGGDNTIRNIRKIESSPMTSEIVFPDRYSACLVNAEVMHKNLDNDMHAFCNNFYNDTYLMDQNACSSPHMIFWIGDNENVKACTDIFCDILGKMVEDRYNFEPIMSIDKYEKLCMESQNVNLKDFMRYKNYLYLLFLDKIIKPIDEFRGKYGYFYNFHLPGINSLLLYVNKKVQTLTYYGFSKNELSSFVLHNKPSGIDRIVPVGKALDMNIIWDGKNIIHRMSRICSIL